VELPFRYCAVAKKAGRYDFRAPHVIGKREPNSERQAAAYYRVAAVKIAGAIEQVHRAAAPTATTLLLSVHFGEDNIHRHAAHKRLPVLPVGCDDPVALLQHGNDANRDGLLPIVQVKKAADLLLSIEFGALILELTDADHLLQEI
jgi:hypothetical protein